MSVGGDKVVVLGGGLISYMLSGTYSAIHTPLQVVKRKNEKLVNLKDKYQQNISRVTLNSCEQ
jgi:alanine dehydrogenase